MTLLKLKSKVSSNEEEETGYVGAYLTSDVTNFLTLYTYAKGISRTSVLQKILSKWITNLKEEEQEDALIKKIVEKAILVWMRKRAKNPKALLRPFKEQLITELEWKKLPMATIQKILTGFNDGTN